MMMSKNKYHMKDFVTSIKNGWLASGYLDVKMVYDEIINLIKNKKTKTEYPFQLHGYDIKEYVENVTHGGIEIEILDNCPCPHARVIVNLDYDNLSTSDYYEIIQQLKIK